MDISSIGGTALTEQANLIYQVACMKMAQHSENVAQYLILDSVEISNEAMEKFLAEKSEQ
ncbi:hypothetical protein J6R97_06255 [bacterium]|nr:hypothetical protein [bacterium]